VFTTASDRTLSRATFIQFTPSHPTSLKFILILLDHLHLGLNRTLRVLKLTFLRQLICTFAKSPLLVLLLKRYSLAVSNRYLPQSRTVTLSARLSLLDQHVCSYCRPSAPSAT
jgi:hypothetical protein